MMRKLSVDPTLPAGTFSSSDPLAHITSGAIDRAQTLPSSLSRLLSINAKTLVTPSAAAPGAALAEARSPTSDDDPSSPLQIRPELLAATRRVQAADAKVAGAVAKTVRTRE